MVRLTRIRRLQALILLVLYVLGTWLYLDSKGIAF
jgi:hypothetical protein